MIASTTPNAYSSNERELIAKYTEDVQEIDILDKSLKTFGKVCYAGVNFLKMDIQGNLRRCSTARESHGNLFEGTMRIGLEAKPCAYTRCVCPYEGIKNLSDRKAATLLVAKEMAREYPVFFVANITKHKVKQRIRTYFTKSKY